ncbi:hypothetical protein VNO77_20371 [Canavalia gladiata]|uniref:C2H2-type domain-containing protein n=1 Tax=Canavalia gladiata TaxID=3824 RepID=A0AAN9LP37_CANGL
MEQGQGWMWTKRKHFPDSPTNYPSTYDDYSWEEQAFAKDASASGCIWPPRSYSCSFCKREFRSAQALGGHMNVHRRDRARLKQPCSPQNETQSHHELEKITHPHNPVQNNSFTSLGYIYHPSSLSGLAHSHNTNPNSDPYSLVLTSSPSKVFATSSVHRNSKGKTLIPLYNNSSIFEGCHESSPVLSSKSWSNSTEECRFYSNYKFDHEAGVDKNLKGVDSGCRSEGDNDKTDMAVSLNLFVQIETKETNTSFKKRKGDASSIQFFPKSCSVDRNHMQSQKFEFSPSSLQELDLELRLGCKPKV